MKFKVCGMKYSKNIADVVALQPDYIGFIFYPRSERYVGDSLSISQMNQIPKHIQKVGVFVNEHISTILSKVDMYALDLVQLHGDESVEYCKKIFKHKIPIIKAFGIDNQFDFSLTNPYSSYCKYFLFDTKSTQYGGTGSTYDWSILNQYDNQLPFFLSGGINEKNIRKAFSLNNRHIHAMDVNSCFEEKPGFKNIQKLRKVLQLMK